MTTTRLFPFKGATIQSLIPPPPAPTRRAYSATAGGFVDAGGDLSGDASTLASGSDGWVIAGTSGATSTRPPNPAPGAWHVDTTLGYSVVFDGASWRNPINGNAV